MPTSVELARELQQKRAELHTMFKNAEMQEFDASGNPRYNFNAEQLVEVKNRTDELATLNDQFENARLKEIQDSNVERLADLRGVDETRRFTPPGISAMSNRVNGGTTKRLSDLFFDSLEYKSKGKAPRGRFGPTFGMDIPDVDVKTLMETTNGFAAPNDRTDRVVLSAQRRPVVADLVPTDPTTLSLVKWMEETIFSNSSAASVAQGGLKPEGAIKFTEQSAAVEKIAVWLPITEEQLDDIPGLRNIIDNRLMLMLQLEEEAQLLSGDGTSPNLRGFLNATGLQTQAKGADSVPDAIYKSFTKVRHTGFAEPSGVVMHPNDWEGVRLLTTADGIYIFGGPADDVDTRIWGKPVVVTTAMTENTALTGDFVLYSHVSRKLGIRIDVSDSHDTYFIYNKLAIRAEMREALEIFRGSAFCQVTGI